MSKSITAVVPARAGSERVINKNTKPFSDSTLLEVKLKMLLRLVKSELIDDIVINSNCEECLNIAEKWSIRYIEREEYYASSECDIRDYWVNVGENIHTNNFMLSQVTSPLISYETYVKCINDFNDSNSISTVTQVKDYLWQGNLPINYELPHHPKSQDLPNDIFKLNFGVCIMSVQDLEKWRNLIIPKTQFVYIDELEALDVDAEIDFKLGEMLYEYYN